MDEKTKKFAALFALTAGVVVLYQGRTFISEKIFGKANSTPSNPEIICTYGVWGPCVNGSQQRLLTNGATGCAGTENRTCTVACVVSDWDSWGNCSKNCGGGTKTRSRTVKVNGDNCPTLTESATCNTQDCSAVVDCVMSSWKKWGNCVADKNCGSGTRTRVRSIITQAQNGGAKCPPSFEKVSCSLPDCPIDCVVGPWTMSECKNEYGCGKGKKVRTREILTNNNSNGKACPILSEEFDCNMSNDCPCLVGDWSEWTTCDKNCGPGKQHRDRSVIEPIAIDQSKCPPLTEEVTCQLSECCVVQPWSAMVNNGWDECVNKTGCGHGTQVRVRGPLNTTLYDPSSCPTLTESKMCTLAPCQSECHVGAWSAWDQCTGAICGTGSKSRSRLILNTAQEPYDPYTCPPLSETGPCSLIECCKVPAWSSMANSGWTDCSATCGTGTQSRSRAAQNTGAYNATTCGTLSESKICTQPDCCTVSAWTAWTPCSNETGCVKSRTRAITSQTTSNCPLLSETGACDAATCSCPISAWSTWSTCGCSNTQTRTRSTTSATLHTNCPILSDSKPCTYTPTWGAWSACSNANDCYCPSETHAVPCKTGTKTRTSSCGVVQTVPCTPTNLPICCKIDWNDTCVFDIHSSTGYLATPVADRYWYNCGAGTVKSFGDFIDTPVTAGTTCLNPHKNLVVETPINTALKGTPACNTGLCDCTNTNYLNHPDCAYERYKKACDDDSYEYFNFVGRSGSGRHLNLAGCYTFDSSMVYPTCDQIWTKHAGLLNYDLTKGGTTNKPSEIYRIHVQIGHGSAAAKAANPEAYQLYRNVVAELTDPNSSCFLADMRHFYDHISASFDTNCLTEFGRTYMMDTKSYTPVYMAYKKMAEVLGSYQYGATVGLVNVNSNPLANGNVDVYIVNFYTAFNADGSSRLETFKAAASRKSTYDTCGLRWNGNSSTMPVFTFF